jgi:hypothetical protein
MHQDKYTTYERIIRSLKDNKLVAFLLIAFALILGIKEFIEAIQTIGKSINSEYIKENNTLTEQNQEKINGWDYKEVNGKVKSFSTRLFSAEKNANGEWSKKSDGPSYIIWEYEFTQDGRLTFENTYNPEDKKLRTRSEYIFKGNTLKTIKIIDIEDGTIKKRYVTKVEPEFKILETDNEFTYEWSERRISKCFSTPSIFAFADYNYFENKCNYDKYGNLIKEVSFFDYKNKPDMIFIEEYLILRTDEKNNWTLRVNVNQYNQNIGDIEEKTIIYY